MKEPFDEIIDIYSENLERVRENQLRNFENSEKFMLWIVGFSIGGLSLIISNFTSFHNHYDSKIIKIVLIFLTISVISGIIYRWAFYSFQIHYQAIEFYLKGAFSNRETMLTHRQDVSIETDFRKLVFLIKYDFGEDLKYKIEEYDNANENLKQFLLNDIKNYYTIRNELAIKDYESAIKYVDDIHKKAFGLSDKKIERIKNVNHAKLFNIYQIITFCGFVISCLTFIFVIILLTILY